jgi:hypothetical protein
VTEDNNQRSRLKRWAMDALAIFLIFISPFIGVVPGPGGIIVLIAGISLLASNHHWAKRFLEYAEEHRSNFFESVFANKKVSLAADIMGILIIISSIFVAFTAENYILRGLSISVTSATLLILLSNQKRFERLSKKLKK